MAAHLPKHAAQPILLHTYRAFLLGRLVGVVIKRVLWFSSFSRLFTREMYRFQIWTLTFSADLFWRCETLSYIFRKLKNQFPIGKTGTKNLKRQRRLRHPKSHWSFSKIPVKKGYCRIKSKKFLNSKNELKTPYTIFNLEAVSIYHLHLPKFFHTPPIFFTVLSRCFFLQKRHTPEQGLFQVGW